MWCLAARAKRVQYLTEDRFDRCKKIRLHGSCASPFSVASCCSAGSNEQSQPQACHANTATTVDGATLVGAMLCATTRAVAPSVLALRSSPPHSNEPSDTDDSSAACVCFRARSGSSHAIYTCRHIREHHLIFMSGFDRATLLTTTQWPRHVERLDQEAAFRMVTRRRQALRKAARITTTLCTVWAPSSPTSCLSR